MYDLPWGFLTFECTNAAIRALGTHRILAEAFESGFDILQGSAKSD
jgi:hypothetical protein